MESLYRKYRPLTFSDVVGQQHIVSTLEHAVSEGRLSHAYLFCGPRGTGKTTLARILAKALLCHEAHELPLGLGCLPDGNCQECADIAAGIHPDVYELDAASRTGVDNVREEIVNSVGFAPVRGRCKVYIIDEVHMLTTAAFNALLKTLEEPPAHVVFVLCTTDPQKVPETILSRCQRFDFHRISTENLIARLRYVCEQETFTYDRGALDIIAKHARGGMRDALTELEQLAAFGNGEVHAADARTLLGETSQATLSRFARGIAARDIVTHFGLVRDQVDEGNDLLELTRDLVSYLRDVYTVRAAGTQDGLVDATPEEQEMLLEEARLFETSDCIARCLVALDDAALQMRDAADTRLTLEIALTRLARPETDLTLEALSERLDRLETKLANAGAPVPTKPMMPAEPVVAVSAEPVTPAPTVKPHPAQQLSVEQETDTLPQAPRASEKSAFQNPKSAENTEALPCASATCDKGELQRRWSEVIHKVTAAQASRGALLQSSRALDDDGNVLTVGLPAGSAFAMKMLERPDSSELILPIANAVFGPRQVRYVMGDEKANNTISEVAEPPEALEPSSSSESSKHPTPLEPPVTSEPPEFSGPSKPSRTSEPEVDPKAILGDIFGAGVIFKDADSA